MSFKCNDCGKTITKVQDIRDCERCRSSGRAASIPTIHQDSDWFTPALLGYLIGSSMSSDHHTHASSFEPDFAGGGGESAGAGASGSFDAPDTSSDSSSSDSGSSSSDSGSSDSSSDSVSSSSDSGGGSGSSDS